MPVVPIEEVSVVGIHGSFLHHQGIGTAWLDDITGAVTRVQCGPFQPGSLPGKGTSYSVSGTTVGKPARSFQRQLTCTVAASLMSQFDQA